MSLQEQLDINRRKVDVDHFDVTLREIIRMTVEGELRTAPEYQRKFRWSQEDESRLIESFFLGLPVPSIFVATNPDGTWEVVDGLQRVSSLVHYAADQEAAERLTARAGPLVLTGLATLTELNDKPFAGLAKPLQLAFLKRMLRVTALSDKSDPHVRFDMFERLNNGGIALTPQEVRECIYRGPFIELVEELGGGDDFQSMLKLQESNQDDGTSEELVLKYFAYQYNRDNFKGRVKDFLNDFAQNEGPKLDLSHERELFQETIRALLQVVTPPFLRSGVHTTPLNQLEAVLVAAADLIRNGVSKFSPKQGWLDDADLVYFSTKGTNTRTMLSGRIERARALLQGSDVKTAR